MSYPEQELGSGSLPNHKIQHCSICKQNGFPHEAIRRPAAYDGRDTYIVDYFTGKRHICKSNKDRWPVIP
jgi:hypothetical protein